MKRLAPFIAPVLLLGFSAMAAPAEAADPVEIVPAHGVLLQVDRPAGADDAAWAREIQTYAILLRSGALIHQYRLTSDLLHERKADLDREVIDSDEKFGLNVIVRVIPGTSLISLQIMVAVKEGLNSALADEYARLFLTSLKDKEAARRTDERARLTEAWKKANEAYAYLQSDFIDYVKIKGADKPIPPNASPEVIAALATDQRMVHFKELEVQEAGRLAADLRRQLAGTEVPPALPVRLVQSAQ